jgi:hypothetical protein
MSDSIIDRKQILQNLLKSTEKLKALFNSIDTNYEIYEITIDDKDISPNYGLYMVLYRIIIKVKMDNPSIEELSGELEEVEKVFESSFRRISLDKFGLIKKPTSQLQPMLIIFILNIIIKVFNLLNELRLFIKSAF